MCKKQVHLLRKIKIRN